MIIMHTTSVTGISSGNGNHNGRYIAMRMNGTYADTHTDTYRQLNVFSCVLREKFIYTSGGDKQIERERERKRMRETERQRKLENDDEITKIV